MNNMTPEEKDLLLKDLCMRLPYNVVCQFEDTVRITDGESSPFYDYVLSARHLDLFINHKNFYIKPYLRSMVSMTEEEAEEYQKTCLFSAFDYNGQKFYFIPTIDSLNWLLKNHFDFQGLIPKGLAIEINKDNNPYK